MEVLIDNRQSRYKISLKKIRQTVHVILNALDFPNGEISILLVDDPQIAQLNQEYLNRKGPTNVIAFPMREGEFSQAFCRLSIWTSIPCFSSAVFTSGCSFLSIFDPMMVNTV